MRKRRYPEMLGAQQVAEVLGIDHTNIDRQVGMPEPAYRRPNGRLWDARDIHEFARLREARRAKREE